jgi:hypothetical protein
LVSPLFPKTAIVNREAVRKIIAGAPRRDVVIALALEQDEKTEADNRRLAIINETMISYQKAFAEISSNWRRKAIALPGQHRELVTLAEKHLALARKEHA